MTSDNICTEGACEKAYEEARLCAHRILKRREKSSHELLTRLQEKGHSPQISLKVVERFADVGLVDDERYTEIYIRSAQAANKGWHRIVRELGQRGIDTEYLEPPFDEDELERAGLVIARLPLETLKERDKALRRLVTKGFSYDIARQAIALRREIKSESKAGADISHPTASSAEINF